MTCCIFAGPSLLPRDREAFPEAVWLPPARQGDVYRIVELLEPRAIGLVDGYFQWAPSVLHKEVLWAMQRGVTMFGAESMGALRAAELSAFGMIGVGRIFDAYRSGRLTDWTEPFEDDDEVAVVHGPSESGYLAASEAMVNVRMTLAEAERQGVIDRETRIRFASIGKEIFFPDRTYDALLHRARSAGLSDAAITAFMAWLPRGRVNQKRLDALQLVQLLRKFMASEDQSHAPTFEFEFTTRWHEAILDSLVSCRQSAPASAPGTSTAQCIGVATRSNDCSDDSRDFVESSPDSRSST